MKSPTRGPGKPALFMKLQVSVTRCPRVLFASLLLVRGLRAAASTRAYALATAAAGLGGELLTWAY